MKVLLLTMQEWHYLKISFTWWGLLAVGFIIVAMVSSIANIVSYDEELAASGFGGIILLIAFVFNLNDY